jgi:hypothetical protein
MLKAFSLLATMIAWKQPVALDELGLDVVGRHVERTHPN